MNNSMMDRNPLRMLSIHTKFVFEVENACKWIGFEIIETTEMFWEISGRSTDPGRMRPLPE